MGVGLILSKESKQVIIKQIEKDLIRYKDSSTYFLSSRPEMEAKTMQQILSLEKALKELRDV